MSLCDMCEVDQMEIDLLNDEIDKLKEELISENGINDSLLKNQSIIAIENCNLKRSMGRIVGMAGNPIAADGCRNIIKLCRSTMENLQKVGK